MTGGRQIAIVDDDDSVRKSIARLVRAAGFDVQTFTCGPQFLDALASYVPHCLVLDLDMPGMNGLDVQVRLARSGTDLPLILITGKDAPGARQRALSGGASAYLLKPVDDSALLGAITAATTARDA